MASTTSKPTGDSRNIWCRRVTILVIVIFSSVFCTIASAYTYNGEITSITISPSTIHGGDNITHSITVQNTGDDGLNIKLLVSGGGDSSQTLSNIIVPVDQTSIIQLITRAPAVDSGQITFTYQLYWNRTSPDSEILLDTETRSVYINQSAPSTGSLYVTSDPSGARIDIDGSYRGTTPIILSGMTTGLHTIIISQSGYTDYSTTATVYAEQTRTVSVTLISSNPAPAYTGSITITSFPSGADVYIDGSSYRGITPVIFSGLTTGSHTIRISYSGYNDYSTTATVYAGQTTKVTGSLNPIIPVPTTSPAAAVPTATIPQTTGSFDPSGLIILLIIGVLVVVGVYVGYYGIMKYNAEKTPLSADESIKILKMRYAKGELTTEEYFQMLENLKK